MGATRVKVGSGDRARRTTVALRLTVFAMVLACLAGAPASGQTIPATLTLEDALSLAEARSERIAIAEAGVARAAGEKRRARSGYHPQLFAELSYLRTFSRGLGIGFGGGGGDTASAEPCTPFTPSPSQPIAERVEAIEDALACLASASPFAGLDDLVPDSDYRWALDLSGQYTVYSGGRVRSQNRLAEASQRSAEIALLSERAQLTLEVTEAYLDARLADQLLEIATGTLTMAGRTLEEVRVGYELGSEAEFEVLRAQVARDSQQPVVFQREAERELAHMRLRRLVGIPVDQEVALADPVAGAPQPAFAIPVPADLPLPSDSAAELRAPVRQEAEAVRASEAQRDIARAQRRPQVEISLAWTPVAYPDRGVLTAGSFQPNLSFFANVSLPLYDGGRVRGEEMIAQADLESARARLDLTRGLAAVDSRSALDRLEAARAAWEASSGTVEQAERANTIAGVRFVEGLGTQLEVMDARLQLDQAQANRARSARDLQVAALRVALLPLLPLTEGTGAGPQVAPEAVDPQRSAPEVTAPRTGAPVASPFLPLGAQRSRP